MIALMITALLLIVVLQASKLAERMTFQGHGQKIVLQRVRVAHGYLSSPEARARLPNC
jgi:hypothetical protein